MATTPKVTKGKFGTITDFGYGQAYTDPRDNPNYTAPVTEQKAVPNVVPNTVSNEDIRVPRTYKTSIDTPEPLVKTPSSEQVYQDMYAKAQGELSALDQYERDLLAEQAPINEKNDRSTQAVSTLSGLAGSTEANVQQQATTAVGQKANQAIRNESNLRKQQLLGNIRKAATDEARNLRLEARQSEQDRIANRAARQQEAQTYLRNISASGVDLNELKSTDTESYNYLVKQYGSETALKGAYTLNAPQEEILDKRIENGKYIIARQNPITGKVNVETVDLGLPTGYSKTIDAGDRIIAVPDNWDGDTSKLKTINKGLTPAQQEKAGTGVSGLDGFPPDIKAAAQSIFDGKSKLNEYPSAKRLAINQAATQLYAGEGGNELAQGAYDAAVKLADHKGFKGAVGTNALLGYGKGISGTQSAAFLAELDKLKANLKLVNIKYLKGTGALSDAEGKTLEDASTSLSPNLPETEFKDELKRVTEALAKAQGVKSNTASTDQYSEFRSQLQPGEILVNRNGQATAITPNEKLPTDIEL